MYQVAKGMDYLTSRGVSWLGKSKCYLIYIYVIPYPDYPSWLGCSKYSHNRWSHLQSCGLWLRTRCNHLEDLWKKKRGQAAHQVINISINHYKQKCSSKALIFQMDGYRVAIRQYILRKVGYLEFRHSDVGNCDAGIDALPWHISSRCDAKGMHKK